MKSSVSVCRGSEAANGALADAAVLGREFTFPALARMRGVSEDELLDVIEEALVSQVIVERPGSSVPTYAFSHALVRETLYDELSLPRKQRKHLAAGQALEAVHIRDRDRMLPILASHFRLAGAAADSAVTLDYARRAADAALAVFAWEDAIAHLETALEVMEESGTDPLARADLATRVGDLIFFSSAEQARGIDILERALRLYEQVGDQRRAAQVHSRLGRALSVYGPMGTTDLRRGLPHLEAAARILADGRDRASLVYLYQTMAAAYSMALDSDAGLSAADRAVEISERLGDDALVASSAVFRALHLGGTGQLDVGRELMDRAREENHRLSQTYFRWCASVYGSNVLLPYGAPKDAYCILRPELDRLEQGGSAFLRRGAEVGLANALIAMGRLDEAQAVLAEAFDDPDRWAELLIARGLWQEALDVLGERGPRFEAGGQVSNACWDEFIAARALSVGGSHDESRLRLERLVDLPPAVELLRLARLVPICVDAGDLVGAERHMAELEDLPTLDQDLLGAAAYVAKGRAVVADAQGDHARAIALLTEAIKCSTRHEDVFEAADSLRRRARSLTVLGRTAEALADLSVSLEIYERAGAGPVWTDPVVAERMALQGVPSADSGASIAVVAASVADDKPDLTSHAAADGTVTLVFTDLGDSTSLNERLGDRAWFEVLRTHHDLIRSLVDRYGGTTVKSQGDGFMLAFPSARRAVECAIAVQRAMSDQMAGDERLSVRIGIHTGEVLRQGEDFFGRHVNLAARVASAARPGQILVSSLVQGLVAGDHGLQFESLGSVELKGFSQPEAVYAVRWFRPQEPASVATIGVSSPPDIP